MNVGCSEGRGSSDTYFFLRVKKKTYFIPFVAGLQICNILACPVACCAPHPPIFGHICPSSSIVELDGSLFVESSKAGASTHDDMMFLTFLAQKLSSLLTSCSSSE